MELVVNLICHKSSPRLYFHPYAFVFVAPHSILYYSILYGSQWEEGGVARKSRASGARHFSLIGPGARVQEHRPTHIGKSVN